MDFEDWSCPQCGRVNEGYRGFCAGCSYQRPLTERFGSAEVGPPPEPVGTERPARTPKPPSDRKGPSVPALVVAWILLVGGLSVVAVTLGRRHEGPTYATAWDSRVQPIADFVEKARELKFDHPVRVDFLPVADFKKKVGEGKPPTKAERKEFEDEVAEMRAVGLVSGDFDLGAAEKKLVTESVIGYYDPDTKHIFVRGDQLTPDVRVTLAHELTHALQDQHYDLRLFRDDRTGQADAYRALYEADAVRIEGQYEHDQLSAAEETEYQQARERDQKEADISSIPPVLTDGFAFPYAIGPSFVRALTDAGGTGRVDQAFARPPASDTEIISPELYLNGFAPVEVDPPALSSGEHRIDKPTTAGQLAMLEILGARLGYVKAWDAVRGWHGDSSVDYRKSGKVCVAVSTDLVDDPGRNRFEAAAREWAKGMPAASVTRDGNEVEIRSCDPGPAFKPPTQDPSVFETLQIRSGFAQGVRESGHLDGTMAACITDRLISQIGPKAFSSLNQEVPDPAVVGVLTAAAPAARAVCQANPDNRS